MRSLFLESDGIRKAKEAFEFNGEFIPQTDSTTAVQIFKADGTTSMFTVDTTNEELLYDEGTKRFDNVTGESSVTSGSVIYFGTAWSDIDSTNLSLTLPTAGTYLIIANLRAHHGGSTSCYGKVRLYNNTDSSAITGSDRMMLEFRGDINDIANIGIGMLWTITVDSADTIRLQGYGEVGSVVGITADANGDTTFEYVRLY